MTLNVIDHGLILIRNRTQSYGILSIGHHKFLLGSFNEIHQKKDYILFLKAYSTINASIS